MTKPKSPTKDEHFVPQVYLRGFSPDKKRIYRFDLKEGTTSNISIPIKSIGFRKNLYEMRDADGTIISRNFIEDRFCKLESAFGKRRDELIARMKQISINHDIVLDFLNEEDRIFWTIIATLQILRNPYILESTNAVLRNIAGDTLSQDAAHADLLGASFPFFKDSGVDNTQLYTLFLRYFYHMELFVGVHYDNKVLTSDNPVFCSTFEDSSLGFGEVDFPLTSNVVLFFVNRAILSEDKGNALFSMDDKIIEHVNHNITFVAFKELYSYRLFPDDQINKILEIQNSPRKREFIAQRDFYKNL